MCIRDSSNPITREPRKTASMRASARGNKGRHRNRAKAPPAVIESTLCALLALLSDHGGSMAASKCCSFLYEKHPSCKLAVKAAGGLRALCVQHAQELAFQTNEGSGTICVVGAQEAESEPTYLVGAEAESEPMQWEQTGGSSESLGPHSFAKYGSIRRLFGTLLEEEYVFGALSAAGYQVVQTQHKKDMPNQSHGRWEIRCEGHFEVHQGYKNNKGPPKPLVDTIVQGLKGWTSDTLDAVALALGHEGPWAAKPTKAPVEKNRRNNSTQPISEGSYTTKS
eukprot:TRINITY_DN20268_c0_g1_i1.p1 TRINITY_DN20268_c0_g1~~TRINITY_DN20268_c0_g1_i1.p1  ORF type:complete len:281 (+),score=47.25 TRINITY_DN20268_c0_g1_i1:163-1005(+)